MKHKKIIEILEKKVNENKYSFTSRDGRTPANEDKLRAHVLLTHFYDSNGDFQKAYSNYIQATQELYKVSQVKLNSFSISQGYESYLKDKEKAEKKIQNYNKNLADFANKNNLGMEESLNLAFVPEKVEKNYFSEMFY
jgi:hypothetical protein